MCAERRIYPVCQIFMHYMMSYYDQMLQQQLFFVMLGVMWKWPEHNAGLNMTHT